MVEKMPSHDDAHVEGIVGVGANDVGELRSPTTSTGCPRRANARAFRFRRY